MLTNPAIIPELNTTIIEPLHLVERCFITKRRMIEKWFEAQWKESPPPVYGSVDLRNAGFKLAPVDMNLFPAGFNNLNLSYIQLSVDAAKKVITKILPNAKRILIIPESHTRNLYYWESMKSLKMVLDGAGFEVRLGTISEDIKTSTPLTLTSGEQLIVEPLLREADELLVSGFKPDIILLNNDLSEGIPEILQNLKVPLIPPAELGWSQRLKSDHFEYYAIVAAEFAETVNIDPWLISPLFRYCGQIDFMREEGIECLVRNAEILFAAIIKKYAEHKIPYQPFLIVKADAGTYGMAVMTVRNIEELKNLNRKQRTRMSTIKGGQPVNRVIIQEGIYTFETLGPDQSVAEPVVYLWGDTVVGGFYRVHKTRGTDENLNAPGMQFEPLAFPEPCHTPREELDPNACPNRFYTYGIVAQLSMLAAAREIKDQLKR